MFVKVPPLQSESEVQNTEAARARMAKNAMAVMDDNARIESCNFVVDFIKITIHLCIRNILYFLKNEVCVAPQRVPDFIVRARVALNINFYGSFP